MKGTVAWVIPTWNGAKLAETLDSIPALQPRMVIKQKETGYPLATAWNRGAAECFARGARLVIIANDDIVVREDTADQLDYALHAPDEDRLKPDCARMPLLVSCYNTQSQEDIGPRWGRGPDYSCFAIDQRYFEKVGPFDEGFNPAFFEDNDSHYRLRLAGYEGYSFAPYFHWGSTTVLTDPERAEMIVNGGRFDALKLRYRSKWGGLPGEETFLRPFDASSRSDKAPREADRA